MNVAIFVQARMGSTRLPGKVMKEVMGRPLLAFLVERLQQIKEADSFTILTTNDPKDDEIVSFCSKAGIRCFRGSEEDVLDRYYQAAVLHKPDAIVRITADCPLIDPDVVDQVIRFYRHHHNEYDYVSNSLVRTYPRGLDVEVFSFKALEKAFHEGKKVEEREHVTPYIYRHPELFSIKNISLTPSEAHHRWTVDTPEDFSLVKLILENLYPVNPDFRMKDVLELLKRHPDWSQLNAHIEQKKL